MALLRSAANTYAKSHSKCIGPPQLSLDGKFTSTPSRRIHWRALDSTSPTQPCQLVQNIFLRHLVFCWFPGRIPCGKLFDGYRGTSLIRNRTSPQDISFTFSPCVQRSQDGSVTCTATHLRGGAPMQLTLGTDVVQSSPNYSDF